MPYRSIRRRRRPVRRTVRRRKLFHPALVAAAGAAAAHYGKRFADKLASGVVDDAASGVRNMVKSRFSTRRKSSPKTTTKISSSKGDQGTGGYSQWSQRYQQASFGKLTPRKIDKLSTDTVIFRHQNIGPFNDYGRRFMYNATGSAGEVYYPLVLFELNSVNNFINGQQTWMHPVHAMYQQAGATANITWQPVAGQDADGTSGATAWALEKSSHPQAGSSSYPMNMSIHKWTSLELELWGQTSKPTMYSIYLCQLSEDVLPTTFFQGSPISIGAYQTIQDQSAVEFWQSMVKRFTYSPLSKVDDGFNNKKIKILKQYKVNIDPTATYENDPDPHVKTLKLFYRFNRKCNFEWKYSNATGFSVADMNDADWQKEAGQNQTQVHPNARMFVMVRASNYVRSTVAGTTNANAPSISWVMRSAHMVNP